MENIKNKIDSFMLNVISSIDDVNDNLYQAMEYVVKSGGKRVRGIILMKLCQLLEVNEDDALICATALEMIHNYSLIHDDLPGMDNDDYRRGMPTCHKKFGEGMAILTGNGFYTLAMQLLIDGLKNELLSSIMRVFVNSSGITGLLSGQAEDITNGSEKDISFLMDLYYLKTGKLFEVAFLVPCILANCNEEMKYTLAEAGCIFGVLYQLSDDLADGDIDGDMAEELKDSLLSKFYSSIDSYEKILDIKTLARSFLEL